jgi:hypothetical protein
VGGVEADETEPQLRGGEGGTHEDRQEEQEPLHPVISRQDGFGSKGDLSFKFEDST